MNLAEALTTVRKNFDIKGAQIRSATEKLTFTHIPTGIFELDFCLLGGIPENLITCIYGHAGSGKSTITYRAVASAQKKYPDKKVVWLDAEGTLDVSRDWAELHGMKFDESLVIVSGLLGEEFLNIMHACLQADDVSMVILDSIPTLLSSKREEVAIGDRVMAETATMLQPALAKAVKELANSKIKGQSKTLIVINQFRDNIGAFSPYGTPTILPGGKAQHYMYTVKIKTAVKSNYGKNANDIEVRISNEHSFTIEKNKVGNAGKAGEFTISCDPVYGIPTGEVDSFQTVVNTAKNFGLVGGAGTGWWYIDVRTGEEIRTTKKSLIVDAMKEDKELYEATKMFLISKQREASNLSGSGWY